MIRERVNAGLSRARSEGKTLGRPKAAAKVEAKILELHASGMGKVRIGRTLGVGTSVVQRVVAKAA
jgi:DNA invertase Pin-like site-specific DNA recombinase